jgi:hypothetical protein
MPQTVTKLMIPASVKVVSSGAFRKLKQLRTEIIIPSTVHRVEAYAFQHAAQGTDIQEFKIAVSGNTVVEKKAFENIGYTTANNALLRVDIGGNARIEPFAFRRLGYGSASAHPNVVIKLNGNARIENSYVANRGAFTESGYYANGFSLETTDNARIGEYTFYKAANILTASASVSLKFSGYSYVGGNAFYYMGYETAANDVFIGVSDHAVFGDSNYGNFYYAFKNAKNTTINVSDNANIGRQCFYNMNSADTSAHSKTANITVSGNAILQYRSFYASFTNSEKNTLTLSDDVIVGDEAFQSDFNYSYTSTTVEIKDRVQTGLNSFSYVGYGMPSAGALKITVSGDVFLGSRSFYHSTGYAERGTIELTLKDNVSVGANCFEKFGYLCKTTKVTISGNVILESRAFLDAGKATSSYISANTVTLTVSGNVTAKSLAFSGFANSTVTTSTINISGNVDLYHATTTSTGIFYSTYVDAKSCAITINTTTPIGGYLWYSSSVSSSSTTRTITIGSNVTEINDNAFNGFKPSAAMQVPTTVQTIGTNAFKFASGTSITLRLPTKFSPDKFGYTGTVTYY